MQVQLPSRAPQNAVASRLPALPLLITLGAAALFFALPWRIISFGFLPPDDALRHAAKAVSGKTWQEIMVMRPDITIDHNPGWNGFLTFLYRLTGCTDRSLVVFSVISMFFVFATAPLPWFRRAEAWLASLALVLIVFPYFAERVFVGRPFLLTMGITLAVLCLWHGEKEARPSWAVLVATTLLLALSTWVHGSWYLLVLIPAVFVLAQQWRKALFLTACWMAGTLLGAIFTGQPWTFLHQSALIPFLALGQRAPQDSLVGEFQPFGFSQNYPAAVIIAAVLVVRKIRGGSMKAIVRDPIFWMALLGWVLGFRIFRFWLDWGLPALVLWVGREFEDFLETKSFSSLAARSAIAAGAALALFAVVANDRDAHWSQYGKIECLDARKPEHASWIPEPGGLLYSVNLSVFYQTFFTNPHGDWKYVLGFEPSFMRAEDLAVYRELWGTLNAVRACAPWILRMKPADRLVLLGGPQIRPAIPQLEWYYAAENTWVGRLPRTSASKVEAN